jgi:molybdopterin molybdotransferase
MLSLVYNDAFEHAIGYGSGRDVVFTGTYELMNGLQVCGNLRRGLGGLARLAVMQMRISRTSIHCTLWCRSVAWGTHAILVIGQTPQMVYTESAISGRTGLPEETILQGRLTTIEEARSMILGEAEALPDEPRSLAGCLGMVLAEDLVAAHDVPPFDNSAMDGYAVFASDTVGASSEQPATLLLAGTIPAGHSADSRLSPGQATRIMTGAPMPNAADAVVQLEITKEAGDSVLIFEAAKPGKNVRQAGGDVAEGSRVLEAGTVLGPAEIGMAASLGLSALAVHRRPRVAIVSTGSELVEVGLPLGPGQIHNSNGVSLRALCQQLGIEPDMLGIAADDRAAIRELISKGLEYDVLLTSGGVSVGAFDFVKEIQADLGVEQLLWGVAMKPGKPLVFGKRNRTLVFGLPGNPVSAMVSFELFVHPALLRLMGYRKTARPLHKATIVEDLEALKERVHVVRVKMWRDEDRWKATSTGDQGSGRMRSMVGANGLVFVPAGSGGYKAGDEVDVVLLADPLEE